MSKQIILDVLDHKKVDRVPVGFWWHYTKFEEWGAKPDDEEIYRRTYEGHRNYFREANIDLLKVMPDGAFVFPNLDGVNLMNADQLNAVKPLDPHDPFFENQVRLIKQLTDEIGDRAAVFPTIFAPNYYLGFTQFRTTGIETTEIELEKALEIHPEALKHAVDVITQDLINLSKRFLTEAGAAGIFLAVHNFYNMKKTDYLNIFSPAEKLLAEEITAVKNYTILHVCGRFGKKNNFSFYADYPFKALNYDVKNENLSLAEAKEKFPDKVVIGGFSNLRDSIIYSGTKEELQAETERLVKEAGRDRLIIGADCGLISEKMNYERVAWIKEKADTL